MSEVKVNKISPRTNCGTTTLGDSGDTFTIPSGVSITNQGTASGFGSTGEVSWVTTKKTATFTATAGEGYFCDTSSSAFTINLPAGTAGNSFAVADYTNTFQTNGLTISPNGSQKIGGVDSDVTLTTEGQSAYFVYVDDTEGWKNVIDSTSNIIGRNFITATGGTITTCGDFKIHTFTGPGTFCVSSVSTVPAENTVGYMVIAGGAGGGDTRGGGGGAGGFREGRNAPIDNFTASPLVANAPTNAVTVTATGFPITVGGGGPGGGNQQGSNSIFSTITATGGGGSCGGNPSLGRPGGSGGGSGGRFPGSGGSGNTPPVSPPQGNGGGNASGASSSPDIYSAGGGGGAGGGGQPNPSATQAGAGGAGIATSITGSSVTRAGGGGGGGGSSQPGTNSNPGAGGSGGGGAGKGSANGPPTRGTNGTTNTGSGGGGGGIDTPSSCTVGGAGGSGIVIIRYKFQ
jgi:hypothetical protein